MDHNNKKKTIIFAIVLIVLIGILAAILIVTALPKKTGENDKGKPFDIAVTFGDDPGTQKNFSWYTEEGIEGSVVQYYPASALPSGEKFNESAAQTAEGFTSKFQTYYPEEGEEHSASGKLGEVTYERHGVYLSGLTPGTEYTYRVGNGQYWSDPGVFRTAPAKAVTKDDGFSFIIVSDTQGYVRSDYELWGDVYEKAAGKAADAAFMVHMGDFVENQDNALAWRYYFSLAPGLSDITTVPVAGNKDTDHFLDYFLLGTREGVTGLNGYYSFDYRGVHFTVLNTGDGNKDLPKSQLKWLKNDLSSEAAINAKHRIVMIHKAPYSDRNHADDSEIVDIRAQVLPVFEEYNVDVVIEGHDHYYFRSEPVSDNGSQVASYASSAVNFEGEQLSVFTLGGTGVFYFMPGASGVKQHSKSFRDMPEIKAARSDILTHPTFCICHVSEDHIYFMTYTVDRYRKNVNPVELWGIKK